MGIIEATSNTLLGTTWSVSSPWSTIYSICPGLVLVGGYQSLGPIGSSAYNQYYYKTFNNLPSHSKIYYTLTVYAIDSWTSTDRFDVRFTGATAWSGSLPQYSVYSFYQNYCGGSTNDLANIRVFGSITHSDTASVTLEIYHLMTGASSAKSVAFRDVNLLFVNNPLSPPADGSCVVSDVAPLPSSTVCACREGLYLLAGSCVPCDPLCASCFGGSPRQCYQCRPGASLMGTPSQCTACSTGCSTCSDATETGCNTCLDGYYLFTPSATSKSCVNSCNYPLINSTDTTGTYLKCASPCAATDFLYWDQSCNSTCAAPLQQNTLIKFVKTCTFPCADDEFLMWDGSCSATCKEPLLQGTYLNRLFCYYTCPISTPQYLYWNGSCADKCMFPFKIQTSHGRQFCVHICDGAEYLYWNGSCHADCPSPLTSRVVDGNLYCDYGCLPTEYLYWDGSCELTCPYPLTTEIQGTVKPRQFCKYLGALTTYLYWNATYPSSCPLPLTTKVYKNRNFCIYPCTSTEILLWNTTCVPFAFCTNGLLVRSEPGALFCDYPCDPSEFLYWDDVCDTACPPPLTQSVVGGTQPRYYCNFGNCAATEYLYWNSSCLTDCPTYHYTTTLVHSRSLCHFPCDFTQFLYYDGSCKLNCPLPYAPRYTAEMNYCDYPCLSTQYLYQNGSCLYSCDFPMLLVNGPAGEKWCNPPCSDPLKYYNMETQTCQAACNHDAKIENVTYLRCLPYVYVSPTGWMDMLLTASADPRAPSFISFHKLSQYVRFVDIDMPPRLEKFVKNQANTIISWDLGFGVPESLGRKITQQNLPTAFERSRVSSSFMANFWSEIIFFGSIVLLTCLLKILEKSVEVFEWHEFAPAIAKIRTIFMWNFCFVLIGYYGDDIILYTCLDIMSMNLDSTPATVSLFLSMFFLILLIGVLILNAYVLYQYRQLKQHIIVDPSVEDERTEEFHKKWNFCLIFYREFRDDTWYQQSFYLIYVLRMVIPIFLVVLTNKIPLAQTIFELIVSISILTFIIWKQPLKRTINHIQLLCYEIGTLIITISALLLASIKPKGTGDEPNSHVRTFLGDLIILGNVYLNITAVVFWVVKAAFEIKNLYTFYKGQYSTERAPWVRLLVVFLQQPAFGFEEMLELNTIDTVPLELAKERQSLTIEKEREMIRKQRNSRKLSQISPAPTTPSSEYGKESDLAPQNYVVNNFEPLKLGSPLDLSRASSIKSIERFRSSMRRGAQPALQVQDQIILEDPEEAEMPNATEMINSPVDLHIPGSSLGSGPGSTPIPRNGYESNRRSRVVSHLNSGRETPTLAEALRKYG